MAERDGIIHKGSYTTEDPGRYEVNEALLDAVDVGDWNVVMLQSLVRWARVRLRSEPPTEGGEPVAWLVDIEDDHPHATIDREDAERDAEHARHHTGKPVRVVPLFASPPPSGEPTEWNWANVNGWLAERGYGKTPLGVPSNADLRPTEPAPGVEPVDAATLYHLRCGWCGAYEGTVNPGEPCAKDSDKGEYIGPHQFGIYERAHPPTDTGAREAVRCTCSPWNPGVFDADCPVDDHRREHALRKSTRRINQAHDDALTPETPSQEEDTDGE